MPADQRSDGIRAGIAELRHEDEVEHIELSLLVDAGEKLIFWMKFNNHGTYINPNNVVEMARMPAVLDLKQIAGRTSPSTNRIKMVVSMSLTQVALSNAPSRPVQCNGHHHQQQTDADAPEPETHNPVPAFPPNHKTQSTRPPPTQPTERREDQV